MENNLPFVSVLTPFRNEENFLSQYLDSVIANSYPKDKLEILLINGASKDKSFKIAQEYSRKYPFIKIIENPKIFIPVALNLGIKNAEGEIVMRMDAHSIYDKEYILKSVKYLQESQADNVGGIRKMIPRTNDFLGKAIVSVMQNPFGAGNAYYRTHTVEKPKYVDTVPFGCFNKEIFKRLGPYDELMLFCEDIEFNNRIKKSGGKILLSPDIVSYHYTRTDMESFIGHTFREGTWITYPMRYGKFFFSWRHLVPMFFVLSLIFYFVAMFFIPIFGLILVSILLLYLVMDLYFSFLVAKKNKDFKYFLVLPKIFLIFHLCYGLGSVFGIIKISFKKK